MVADSLRGTHDLPFVFSDVVLTPGAMAGLQLALRVAGGPGDEVIIPVPCWLDYPLYVRSLGLVPVMVPLASETFELDQRRSPRRYPPRPAQFSLANQQTRPAAATDQSP